MSEGREFWGGGGRSEGRGAGRGTADASTGGREGSTGAWEVDGFRLSAFEPGDFAGVGEGVGDLASSAFSLRFGFGASFSLSIFFWGVAVFSDSVFFPGVGDLLPSDLVLFAGVSLAFAFGFGVTSSSWPLLSFPDDFAFG